MTISQGTADFALEVPIRLHYGERQVDLDVAMSRAVETLEIPCEPRGLTAVELDPDYHVFRKLKPEEVMPTSALTRRAETLTVVVPPGDLWEGYRTVLESYKRAVAGTDEEPKKGHEVTVLEPDEIDAERLASSDVLILGEAVRHPRIERFLAETRSPVSWSDSAFEVEGERYDGEGHAVFFTVHHPEVDDGGVTVYYGNSPASLSNAGVLSYYPNSLLVYDTPPDGPAEDAGGMPRAEVLRRIDFEFHERIDF